ncbi:MAG: DNA polymerase III subunit delta' [Desulfarculaceae bacterium]|nr:DNA polymerase III subunit delta' [Desulfarculaceae bacterium]
MMQNQAALAGNSSQLTPAFRAESELEHIVKSGKFPNALLFTGKAGFQMADTAEALARVVNCEFPKDGPFWHMACRECRPCKKIGNRMHPDILRIMPEKGVIKISRIRDLCTSLTVRANEAFRRVVIFHDAETMNTEAQNALLKTLEEPPRDTLFILVADNTAPLLPTVVSRCRHIPFKVADSVEIKNQLMETHGINAEYAAICAAMADGDIQRSLRFAGIEKNETDTDWVQRRKWLIGQIEKLVLSEEKNGTNPLEALLTAEYLDKDPDLLKDSLAVIRSFLRDLAVIGHTENTLVNTDFFSTLRRITANTHPARILSWIGKLHETERKIESNATLRLVLENFFTELLSNTQKV